MFAPLILTGPEIRSLKKRLKTSHSFIIPVGVETSTPVAPEQPRMFWIQEDWRAETPSYFTDSKTQIDPKGFAYRADADTSEHRWKPETKPEIVWQSASTMPREASRFTLVLTGTSVRRLRDLTDVEAEAEGIYERGSVGDDPMSSPWAWDSEGWRYDTPRQAYEQLWKSLHGEASWKSDPYVAVVTFERHRSNIEALLANA